MTRISEKQRFNIGQKRVEAAKNDNARSLDELSSQKQIREISDNPVGMTRAIKYKDRVGTIDQHIRNIEFSKGFLSKAELSMVDISDNLMRAKELAVAMANDTNNASSREATAHEIQQIMSDVVQLGNAQFNGRYVFGGFRTQSPALSIDGDFLGDDGGIFLEMTDGNFKQINIQARYLFETSPEDRSQGHYNMLHSLEMLYDGLRSNDKAQIQKSMNELDFQIEKTTSHHAVIGSLWKSLDQTQGRAEKEIDFQKASLSGVMDVDSFKSSSEFKRTETVLQSTLLATNKMLQPSLLNFMQ